MINGKLIKVCGMTLGENILEVESLGVDMMGFIFYPPSPRYVKEVPTYLPQKAKRAGVFVNSSIEEILNTIDSFKLDIIQLHGNETPEQCYFLRECGGVKVMKAFGISDEESLHLSRSYEGTCDMYLFDTKASSYGGSGKKWDWSVLSSYRGKTPFLLSGGIGPDDAPALKEGKFPKTLSGFDLNSRFELSPGIKDAEKVEKFLNELKA
ncbi:MAG: phosphoribosylanthranilate isomerase [Bacteroidales bacterium]|nr:phosphoribosylanthranilate isomerase [Bacteroidales bacterium]